MNVVFFDFDKTLTCVDTTLPFAFFLCKERNKRYRYLHVIILFLLYRFVIITHRRFKQKLCEILVKNMAKEHIIALSHKFFDLYFDSIKNDKVIEKCCEHSYNGDLIYIVSSNFDFFLEPVYNLLPLQRIEATMASSINDIFTGKLNGDVCDDDEKLARAMSLMSQIPHENTVFYGDNAGDYSLMKKADIYYIVRYPEVTFAKKFRRLLKAFCGRFDFQKTEIYFNSRF
jgi:HAD superfamily phosphoserine phosphatase-like hydrolase